MASPAPENQNKPGPQRRGPRRPPGDEPQRPPPIGGWLILLVVILFAVILLYRGGPTGTRVESSFFWDQLMTGEVGNVKELEIRGDVVTGTWREPPPDPEERGKKLDPKFHTVLPPHVVGNENLAQLFEDRGVTKFDFESTTTGLGTQFLLYMAAPFLLLLFFWFMIRRSADPMGGSMMGNFIRSPAKRFRPSGQVTTFDDVAAMDQAKRELQEIVEFLKTPGKFQRLGAQIPKGVLLMGPPGTGKTLLARATAGEAGVPFFSINGSEFIQMFVGVGASRVRDLFSTAKEAAPCILFIDEIDAVGRIRGAGVGGGHDEREQTLNQILSEMDGFQPNETVIVLAATNRPDVLDPALLRPGRFDRHITIDRPNRAGRVGILKVHCRKVPLASDVDLEKIASGTIGFSGADLRNLVNEAALIATREGKSAVDMEDFESARDRVLMGPAREEVLNEHEKEMTAYHESGHALLAWLFPDVDTVHKVTIIPRGRALGVTQLLPDEERFNIGERRLHSQLTFILGGRAAEKLVFNEFTAGAEDDLKKATQIARRMVGIWGMSEVIGPVAFIQGDENPFLGKEMHEQRKFSEDTARIIDQEVQRILNESYERAVTMLTERREELDRMAQALIEKESLGNEELIQLIGERPRSQYNGQKLTKE